MKTAEAVKKEKIAHLEYCMERLLYKENNFNEIEIRKLYKMIYCIVSEMKEKDAMIALAYYREEISDEIRNALKHLNIEIIV